MDYKIIFSDPAVDDPKSLVRYIAKDNQKAASELGGKLIESVRNLAKFPRFGRVVPEQNDENIREMICKPYRIFYRVKDEVKVVEVIRFWHVARGEPRV